MKDCLLQTPRKVLVEIHNLLQYFTTIVLQKILNFTFAIQFMNKAK